jgi:hypothetical protein
MSSIKQFWNYATFELNKHQIDYRIQFFLFTLFAALLDVTSA